MIEDYAFGLLDPADSGVVAAHLPDCADCQAEAEQAARLVALTKVASSANFPVQPFTPPAVPNTLEPTWTVRAAVVRWAVAASLFLGGATLLPAALDSLNGRPASREMATAMARLQATTAEVAATGDAVRAENRAIVARRTETQSALDALADEWVDAEAQSAPRLVTVSGPGSAVAGAPNVFPLKSASPVEVQVTDARGVARFHQSLGANAAVRLPATLWVGDSAPERLTLTAGGRELFSRPLATPVYSTHLASDRTLYRPGETIYARSVTLDRERFRPPPDAAPVWFDLEGSTGVVPGSGKLAQTAPADATGKPLLGPDGKPIHGLGTVAIALPADLKPGDYKLRVAPAAPGGAGPLRDAVPTTIPVVIARTAPPRFDRVVRFGGASYGPGDEVTGSFTVSRSGKPIPGAKAFLHAEAVLAGKPRKIIEHKRSLTLSPEGVTSFRFRLPAGDLTAATVSLTVEAGGISEYVIRAVPVASPAVWLELFPEGGELVAGIPGRVYLRTTGSNGKPADVSGALLADGREVARFRTATSPNKQGVNRGLGAFDLTPRLGATYSVRLDAPAGSRVADFAPPKVAADGVALTANPGVTAAGEPLSLTLTSNRQRPVVIGAYRRGLPLAHRKLTLKAGEPTKVLLDLAGDAGGVVRVTLFEDAPDADLKPLAERLVFRRPARSLTLSATPQTSPRAGQSLELGLRSLTESGTPAGAILLAAVTHESNALAADDTRAQSLPTYFLLTDELERPETIEFADFLLTDAPGAAGALDRLLATQGWRRFAEQKSPRDLAETPGGDRLLAGSGAMPTELLGQGDFATRANELRRVASEANRAMASAELLERHAAGVTAQSQAAFRYESVKEQAGPLLAQWHRRAAWWPAGVGATFAFGFVFLGLGRLGATYPERRWLRLGAAGFLALGLAGTLAGVTAPRPGVVPTPAPPPVPPLKPAASPAVPETVLAMLTRGPNDVRPIRPHALSATPFTRPGLAPRDTIEQFTPRHVRAIPVLSVNRLRLESPLGEGARLTPDAPANMLNRLARETDPARRAAAKRVAAKLRLPATQPVREFAHANTARAGVPQTLLWKPCVVTDASGQATVTFDLPPAPGAYRVTLAGHTPDGRLGATTSRFVVEAGE